MLTRRNAIVVYEAGRAVPDRLHLRGDRAYFEAAREALDVYRAGAGRSRETLHANVWAAFDTHVPDAEPRRRRAFCALLDEASRYERDRDGRAGRARLLIFTLAARRHPLSTADDATAAREWIAKRLGRRDLRLLGELHPDAPDRQRLLVFAGYENPEALLARYNVAQFQAALYRALSMTLFVRDDLRAILRPVRLAGLLHEIRRTGPGRYRIDCTGPAALLRATHHYGVRMARVVPALLACRGWRLTARLRAPRGVATLTLSSSDGLSSGRDPPARFDSALEETFARRFGPERSGWRLHREADVLHDGQHTFVPDFTLRHRDGREVLLEIVGFWTPEYLSRKAATLRRFARSASSRPMIVAVRERTAEAMADLPVPVVTFKSALRPESILARMEAF